MGAHVRRHVQSPGARATGPSCHRQRRGVGSARRGSFDWRSAVRGRLEMRLAPQYWLWQAAGLTHDSAARYFCGFADHVLGLWVGEGGGAPPLDDVLPRIEKLVRGAEPGPAKT